MIAKTALIRSGALSIAFVVALQPSIQWLPPLRNEEDFAAARLTAAERHSIVEQLEASSFDVPDDWAREVRVRRIDVDGVEDLLIRGTDLLCGATGNCQTWVFRHEANREWRNGFASQAPMATSVGFDGAAAIKDIVLTANRSADAATWTRYRFDGRYYRAEACVDVAGGVQRAVPCP
jgi:hypothetical protein